MPAEDPQKIIEGEVESVLATEKSLAEMESELAKNELFQNFLTKQKEAKVQIADTWKMIEKHMIEHNIKSIKGDWGSITITEKPNYSTNEDELPAKFFKKVPDVKKIGTYFTLEGKLPKGVERTITKYLMKRIK